jgi:hypothetical protein
MWNVVKVWANADAEKSMVVATHETEDAARTDAQKRFTDQSMPWAAFVVEPALEKKDGR